jgi:hypothetical protein
MILYQVTVERDGLTCKAPGVTETEVKHITYWYVADDIETVWQATEQLRTDPECRFLGINESVQGVKVLGR